MPSVRSALYPQLAQDRCQERIAWDRMQFVTVPGIASSVASILIYDAAANVDPLRDQLIPKPLNVADRTL